MRINQLEMLKKAVFIAIFIISMYQVSAQTIYVNDNSTTNDIYTSKAGSDGSSADGSSSKPYLTFSMAMSVAPAGSTIIVDAGTYTYTAGITISKALTFRGANFGANGSSGTRIGESIIRDTRIIISGSGAVVIDGFYVYQTTTLAAPTISISNTPIIVRNCKIERVGSTAGVLAVGLQTQSGTTAATIVSRNLFTGSVLGGLFSSHRTWNTAIFCNGGTNITIDSNTIQGCRTGINCDNMSSGVAINNNIFNTSGTHISFGGSLATTGSYTLSRNTFSITSGYVTINCSNVATTFRLDLTNNIFGTKAASSMTLDECFAVENTLAHKGASSKNGLVRVVSGKLYKTATTTITNNVLYANANDIIHVTSGSVSETITINKSVKLYGNNYNINPNTSSFGLNSSRVTETVITGGGFTVAASDIEVSGFKFAGLTSGVTAVGNTNPSSTLNGIVISNNWFTGNTNVKPIWFTASSGQAYSGLQISNNRIETNTYSPSTTQISGIDLWRSGAHTISGNYIDGASFNGIKSDGYGVNVISGNRLVNCRVAGISVQATYSNGQTVTVNNNTISGSMQGVVVWSSTTSFSNIKFQVANNVVAIDAGKLDINYPGISVQNISSGDNTYTNVISGNSVTYSGTIGSSPYGMIAGGPASAAYGFTIIGNVGKLDVQNNLIDGGNVAGLTVSNANLDMAAVMVIANFPYSFAEGTVNTPLAGTVRLLNNDMRNFKNGVVCYNYVTSSLGEIPTGVSLAINDNSILPSATGKAIIAGNSGVGISGTCNWYGSADYLTVLGKITGNVTFISFLVNGTDNNTSLLGFQPLAGICTGVGVLEPTLGASAAVFTALAQTTLSFRISKGNGDKRVVFAKPVSAITVDPANNTTYAANSVYGSGAILNSGFAVYNDTGSVISITGLSPNTIYYFTVYEYNFNGTIIQYATSLKYQSAVTTLQPDADADGIPDVDDEYPNDAFRAFNIIYPASGFGTLMYEDLWPSTGDYDFNDLVVDYRYNTVTNASNQVVEVSYKLVTRAVGGGLHNGFAFQLDGINPNKITSVSGSKASGASWISLNSNGTEAGQLTNANFLVFDDAYKLLSVKGGFSFINVSIGAPSSGTDTTTLLVKFINNGVLPPGGAIDFVSFGSNLFNPYIILGQNRGKEVHLINRLPSSKADVSFFGKEDDRTVPGNGAYYKTANNLPWAINISTSVPYPNEKTDISEAYLKFIDWAISNGANQTTWYMAQDGKRDNTKLWIR